MASHALLSASGADRWMACTPSPRAEESVSEESSEFGETKGTVLAVVTKKPCSIFLKLKYCFKDMK